MSREDDKPGEAASDSATADFPTWLRRIAAAPAEHAPELLPRMDQVIGGKYRITGLIGKGGMGAVYRATRFGSEDAVAVKWLLRSVTERSARARFIREALAPARVNHPNVVKQLDVGQQGSNAYLVLELLHGFSLQERLQAGPLPAAEALSLLPAAMRGVAAMHREGVIHRDLKPANLFLCDATSDQVPGIKVLDFGVSAIAGSEKITVSGEGALVGTLAYMAPEQFSHPSGVDARADVYSFGVILHEVLTASLPWLSAHPQHRTTLRPDVALPQGIASLVKRALEPERDRRYPDLDSFAAALDDASCAVRHDVR
jgi:serine/threonine protein kinase